MISFYVTALQTINCNETALQDLNNLLDNSRIYYQLCQKHQTEQGFAKIIEIISHGDKNIKAFLRVLRENGHLYLLPSILSAIALKEVVHVILTTPTPYTRTVELIECLERRYNKPIKLEQRKGEYKLIAQGEMLDLSERSIRDRLTQHLLGQVKIDNFDFK